MLGRPATPWMGAAASERRSRHRLQRSNWFLAPLRLRELAATANTLTPNVAKLTNKYCQIHSVSRCVIYKFTGYSKLALGSVDPPISLLGCQSKEAWILATVAMYYD